MRKWSIILAILLLCLTGCGKQDIILDRPHALEVSYGDSSVFAMTNGYQWNWKEGRKTDSVSVNAVDPRAMGQKLPWLSTGTDSTLSLAFAVEPDNLLVEMFTADDGYAVGQQVEASSMSFPAPLDGTDHLFTITATWEPGKGVRSWGTCTYHFRFLAQAEVKTEPTVDPDVGDLDILQVLQMDANQFMGMEFMNNVEGLSMTCRTRQDKSSILQFLKDHISTDFTTPMPGAPEALYMIRLVSMDGAQLTVGYGSDGLNHSLLVGGMAYAAEEMDFDSLWSLLNGDTVTHLSGTSLDRSDEIPDGNWGDTFVYAYLTDLGETASYDEMRWIEDPEAPNGYHLEKGWPDQSMPVSADCQYWILENGQPPYCRVAANALMETDGLYRIYTEDDTIIAICQQYTP